MCILADLDTCAAEVRDAAEKYCEERLLAVAKQLEEVLGQLRWEAQGVA